MARLDPVPPLEPCFQYGQVSMSRRNVTWQGRIKPLAEHCAHCIPRDPELRQVCRISDHDCPSFAPLQGGRKLLEGCTFRGPPMCTGPPESLWLSSHACIIMHTLSAALLPLHLQAKHNEQAKTLFGQVQVLCQPALHCAFAAAIERCRAAGLLASATFCRSPVCTSGILGAAAVIS